MSWAPDLDKIRTHIMEFRTRSSPCNTFSKVARPSAAKSSVLPEMLVSPKPELSNRDEYCGARRRC
jgi:hypothetical protein